LKTEEQPRSKIDVNFLSQFDCESIYATNAFRLLQLPVSSTDRDITHRKQIIEISLKNQSPVPDGPCKIYPIDITDDHLDLNNLVDSLRDPIRRFYQEFFWFWPVSDDVEQTDPGLPTLSMGGVKKPVKIFSLNSFDPKEAAINLHNMAIFNHFCALNNPESKSSQEIIGFWQEAYKYWSDLAVLSDFWSLLSSRVREVNDPRLSDNHVTTLRESALSILAFTNAQQAVRLIETEDIEGATELLKLIPTNQKNLPRNNILKLATSTNKERLLAAESAVEPKMKEDPARCDDEIESLLTEGNEELRIFGTIFSNTSPEFAILRDGLVEAVLNALDEFFIKTEDYSRSIDLIKSIEKIPINSKIKKEINNRLENYTDFGDNKHFWHCKDYYNNGIPSDLFIRLEEARESYDRQDYAATIKMLDHIASDYQSQSRILHKAIHPPLAITLNQQALEMLDKASIFLDAPRQVLTAIANNLKNKDWRCLDSINKIQYGRLEYTNAQLYCMSCLSIIYGRYYIGKINDLPFVVCERCEMSNREEFDNNKRKARPLLNQSKELLLRANLIQPENKLVKKNLELLRDIFKEVYFFTIDINPKPQMEKPPKPIVATTQNQKPAITLTQTSSTNQVEIKERPAPPSPPTTSANSQVKPVTQYKTKRKKSLNKRLIAAAVIINLAVVILLLILIFGISPDKNAPSRNLSGSIPISKPQIILYDSSIDHSSYDKIFLIDTVSCPDEQTNVNTSDQSIYFQPNTRVQFEIDSEFFLSTGRDDPEVY